MYEELVKRLRTTYEADVIKNHGILLEAADAIEELSQEHKSVAASLTESVELVRKLQSPRWVSVTERLPESGVHVLASCRVKYVGGGGRSYVCDAFYSERFKEQRSTEYDDIELDYDEQTDEYYLPEGWWEVIRNWDEYEFVGIADFVTHWMPLPEPPEEET